MKNLTSTLAAFMFLALLGACVFPKPLPPVETFEGFTTFRQLISKPTSLIMRFESDAKVPKVTAFETTTHPVQIEPDTPYKEYDWVLVLRWTGDVPKVFTLFPAKSDEFAVEHIPDPDITEPLTLTPGLRGPGSERTLTRYEPLKLAGTGRVAFLLLFTDEQSVLRAANRFKQITQQEVQNGDLLILPLDNICIPEHNGDCEACKDFVPDEEG